MQDDRRSNVGGHPVEQTPERTAAGEETGQKGGTGSSTRRQAPLKPEYPKEGEDQPTDDKEE